MTDVFKKKRINSLDTTTTGYNPMIFNLLTFNIDVFTCLECSNESCRYEYCTILSLPVKPTLKECFEEFINIQFLLYTENLLIFNYYIFFFFLYIMI